MTFLRDVATSMITNSSTTNSSTSSSPTTSSTSPSTSSSPAEVKAVFWLFHIGSEDERRPLDYTTSTILWVIFVLCILSHLPSLALLLKDLRHKKVNNAVLIYRHIFVLDLIIIFGYIPADAVWTVTRSSLVLCQLNRFALFTGFFGGGNFLIILAVDRCAGMNSHS